jgi:hypothetical protein
MKIKLTFAAITLAVLSAVSCHPDKPIDPCKTASDQSARNRDWIKDASMDGASGDELTRYCKTLITH